jgi:Domain of unknown function (DUF6250)
MRTDRRRLAAFLIILLLIFICGIPLGACSAQDTTRPSEFPDARFAVGEKLYRDDFGKDDGQWICELENGGSVKIGEGRIDIDVPAGATVWFKPMLHGPVLIQYDATVISAGGPNDRVSDLNCFWMARDARNPANIFAVQRSGKFSDYNPLRTYYVGLGGNGNSTTRFRRYIGDASQRPLRPQDDLRGSENMITPNQSQLIQLVACGEIVQYYRDKRRIFDFSDPHPYTSGWFALRTTRNHMQVRNFSVFELIPRPR